MRFLKQNTATRVTVGPFLDKTDGITPEVALTATNEKLTLMVDDGGVPTLVIDATATASGGNNDLVHVTNDDAGYYDLELTAAQTNYVGRAHLSVQYATDHCPVFHEFMILPANVFDAWMGTDKLDTNAAEVGGTAQTGRDLGASVLLSSGTGAGQISLSSGAVLLQATQTGVTIPTVTTLTNLPAITSNWLTAAGIAADAITAAKVAADVTTEIQSGLATAASLATVAGYLDTEIAAILADTNELQTDLVNGGRLDLLVDAIKAKTDLIPASPAAVGSQMDLVAAPNATAVTAIQSGLATAAALSTVDDFLDTEIAAIKAKTDNLPASPAAVGSAMTLAAGAVDAAAVADGAFDAASFAADVWTRLGIVAYGTAQAATGTTLQLASAAAFADDELNGAVIVITGGSAGVGQSRVITDYVSSTDTATVDAWTTTPTGTITYVIFAAPPATAAGNAAIADAVWDEALSGHSTAGSAGKALSDAGSAGDPWSTAVPGAYGAGTAGNILGNRLAGTIATGTHNPQSGDAYARLGAPAGASIAADLVTIDNLVDDLESRLGTPSNLGGGATIAANLADIEGQTDDIGAAGAGLTALASAAALSTVASYLDTEVAAILTAVDTEIAAIKAKTDLIPASPAATGDIPTASAIADAVLDDAVEGTITLRKIGRALIAWFGGLTLGAGTTNPRFRDQANSKNRIDMTVNTTTGERSAVTLDLD